LGYLFDNPVLSSEEDLPKLFMPVGVGAVLP
jgi:hypothetical protein